MFQLFQRPNSPLLRDSSDVEQVKIKGKTLFLYDGTLYKQIPTTNGIQYEVYGFIDE